jgi:hypothetical protein
VLADQSRLKRALAVARDLDRHRAVVGPDGLPARPVAVIGRVVRLDAAGRIAEMMGERAAQRAFDERFLEAPDSPIELLGERAALAERTGRELRTELVSAVRRVPGSYDGVGA